MDDWEVLHMALRQLHVADLYWSERARQAALVEGLDTIHTLLGTIHEATQELTAEVRRIGLQVPGVSRG